MPVPSIIVLAGPACSGKTALAAWLCRRMPQPVAGVCTLCTGRGAAGAAFSLQDLMTGAVYPLPDAYETFGSAALRDALSQNAPTVLLDEAGGLEHPIWRQSVAALLQGTGQRVLTVQPEDLPALQRLCEDKDVRYIDLTEASPAVVRAQLAREWPAPLHAGVSVRLFREEKCFGPGPMQLLELVGRTGSLHQAAAAMGMAYSKAWKMLGELERQWGFAMLERHPDGSLLTPRAWELLHRYRALRWQAEHAVQQSFAQWFGDLEKGI